MSSGELQNVGQGDIVIKYYDQISLRNLATRLIDDPKKTEAVTFSGVMYAALKQLETLKQEREDLRRSLSQLGKYIDNVKEAGA